MRTTEQALKDFILNAMDGAQSVELGTTLSASYKKMAAKYFNITKIKGGYKFAKI